MLWKLVSRPVVTISRDAPVEEAARALRTRNREMGHISAALSQEMRRPEP